MDRKIVEQLIAGKSLREIMELFRVGDRRVRKLKLLAEQYGYLGGATALPQYPEALFPDGPDGRESRSSDADRKFLEKKDWMIERLAAGWSPITVFEELGIPVGRSSFYRFIQRHGLHEVGAHARRVVPEIIHQPAEALILDWGKLRDVVDEKTGKKKILWAFVGVLGFSRYMMVRLVWSNETSLTLESLENMLREIGGTPGRVTSDNPKCFALEASDYEPLLNPAFERFAAHYGMRIECLPPSDPEKKGKVERLMPYVRRLYEAHGAQWRGIEESQAYMDRKVAIANERQHGTTRMKPIEQFLQIEVGRLSPLPALAYSHEEISEGVVRKDGHVRFDSHYYSLEEQMIGKSVMILASSSQVSIYYEGKLKEVHQRLSGPVQSKSTKPQHLKPWEQAMKDHSLYRKRAQALGPAVDQFVLTLLNQGQGFIDTRKIWGILSLDKSFEPAAINQACQKAIELDSYSYRTVKSLLKLLPQSRQKRQELTASPAPLASIPAQENKFVRPMSVYEEQLKLIH
jgi:Integrase core domain